MAKVVKSSLQSLIAGEPLPVLPAFDPSWSIKQYNDEMSNWQRKLMEYLRRLIQHLTGDNIFNELIQQLTINQLTQLGGGGSGDYGFGPVSIEVYQGYQFVDDTTPFPKTGKVGTIKHCSTYLGDITNWVGIGQFETIGGTGTPVVTCTAIRIQFKLTPAFSENYTLDFNSDDGRRVYLNDVLVNDAWGTAGGVEYIFAASAGVPIVVRFEVCNSLGGSLSASLIWKSHSQTNDNYEKIPFEFLSPI